MKKDYLGPPMLAAIGVATIAFGLHQELVHVAAGYEARISAGGSGALNHEERLLLHVGVVGLAGTLAAVRWRRLAAVPVAMGGLVVLSVCRTLLSLFRGPHPLYQEFTLQPPGSEAYAVMLVLGAEPFVLVVGGLLLAGAGVAGLKLEPPRPDVTK